MLDTETETDNHLLVTGFLLIAPRLFYFDLFVMQRPIVRWRRCGVPHRISCLCGRFLVLWDAILYDGARHHSGCSSNSWLLLDILRPRRHRRCSLAPIRTLARRWLDRVLDRHVLNLHFG